MTSSGSSISKTHKLVMSDFQRKSIPVTSFRSSIYSTRIDCIFKKIINYSWVLELLIEIFSNLHKYLSYLDISSFWWKNENLHL